MRVLAILAPLWVTACAGEPPPETTKDQTVINDKDGDGFTSADGDCNDDDAMVYPGANDVVGDDVDQNCDDIDGLDDDGDGHAWTGSGGDDCDDDDPEIYGGAEETGWDGIDQSCSGDDQYDFDRVCAGKSHTCALATNGIIQCWGSDQYGQVGNRPLDAGWVDLDCGYEFTCAVNEAGGLQCWGRDEPGKLQVSGAPTKGIWDSVHLGHYHACALEEETNLATCWGENNAGKAEAPAGVPFADLGLGADHSCGVTRNLRIMDCWGEDGSDQLTDMPNAQYFSGWISVTSGGAHSCGIREDQGLKCWGENNFGQTEAPSDAGPYSHLATMGDFTCGVLEAERLSCWGLNTQYQVSTAPLDGEASLFWVAPGVDHACAILNEDGSVICWGKDDAGQATVPDWP